MRRRILRWGAQGPVARGRRVEWTMRASFTRWPVLVSCVLAAACLTASGSEGQEPQGSEPLGGIYVRRATLQDSLLASRAAYAARLAEQAQARQAVKLGPWHLAVGAAAEPAAAQPPGNCPDLSAKTPDGKPVWAVKADWQDGAPFDFGGDRIVLTRILTASSPAKLLVGVGGGDDLTLDLNGARVLAAKTKLPFGRYGTSMQVDGTRVDQVVCALPVLAGENRLVLTITQTSPGPRQAFFSTTPNPVPYLWRELERDFPRATHHLLDVVRFDWFKTDGWFAQTDARLERQLVEGLVSKLGERGATVRQRLQKLAQPAGAAPPAAWLDLSVQAAELHVLLRDLERVRASATHLATTYPDRYPGAEAHRRLAQLEQRILAQAAVQLDPTEPAVRQLAVDLAGCRSDLLVKANPLLRNETLLFVKRYTYDSQHFYDDYYNGLRKYGGSLCSLSLRDGAVKDLAPQLTGGIFDRFDLSFDGRRVVFGYRRPQPEGFRIWEAKLDGSGLRQLTFEPEDEGDRMARFGLQPLAALQSSPASFGHWTDDMHPCYLPSGEVVFASSRSERTAVCGGHTLPCTVLYKMDGDGRHMQRLSQGMLSEFAPTVLEDGRILYTRWEYVYKGIAAIQPLWAIRPDGSGGEEIYGDNIRDPGVFYQARQVPDRPNLIVCNGCGHEPLSVGAILLLDLKKDKRTAAVMTSLTPDTQARELRGLYQQRNGKWRADDVYGPFYCDPYPLSDKYFLVSCNPDRRYNDESGYGLYLLDAFGNLIPLHRDAEMSCFEPLLLKPRPTPPALTPTAAPGALAQGPQLSPSNASVAGAATVFLADVYQGLNGVRRGDVKYLRILRQIPRPWSVWPHAGDDGCPGQMVAVSWYSHIWIAVLEGIVPVHPDGSAYFTVPADCNLFFQVLDGDYLEVQRMRTFVNFRPGEQRSCIGCHEPRSRPPEARGQGLALALQFPPAKPGPQPGDIAPRPLHYEDDVQPVLDKHCVSCHGNREPEGGLVLTGDPTTHFNRSYEELLSKQLVKVAIEWAPPPGRGSSFQWSMEHAPPIAPYAYGSHASRLIQVLRQGHYDVRLSQPEFVKLSTWVDTNGQYYGSYFGHRNLRYRASSEFRLKPTLAAAYGERPGSLRPEPLPPPPAELVAHWTFDEKQGDTARDASGHNHHGTLVGATWTAGKLGGAVAFSGDSAHVRVGDLPGTFETLSIACWLRADSHKNRWNPLLFCDDWSDQDLHLSVLAEGPPNVAIHDGSAGGYHRAASLSVGDGQWHHLVLVCDQRPGGQLQFFVDGKPDRRHLLYGAGTPVRLTGVRLGGYNVWQQSPQANFHGALDDFRIYRGLLTAAQIGELAGAGK